MIKLDNHRARTLYAMVEAWAQRPETRAVADGTATPEQALIVEGMNISFRHLVEILYPGRDLTERTTILGEINNLYQHNTGRMGV